MAPPPSPSDVASALLASKGLHLKSIQVLQSLWAGYGQICRITATPASPTSSGSTAPSISTSQEPQSFIIKLIAPPPADTSDEGHLRKLLSYQVEQYFYTHLAPQLPASIPVANVLTNTYETHADGTFTLATILADLKQDYPLAGEKRSSLSQTQTYAALDWLSSYHAFWWTRIKDLNRDSLVRPPLEQIKRDVKDTSAPTVWLNGGYTYLSTRLKEYATLANSTTSPWTEPLTDWEEDEFSISEIVASVLAPRKRGWSPTADYLTLIHGDVKSENLFTTRDEKTAVFYDFQYTGLGLGVSDLAKLFTCSIPLDMLLDDPSSPIPHLISLQTKETILLKHYWRRLTNESGKSYEWDIFVAHWETALVDWLRFQASWGFWGNTEWLEGRVRCILKNEDWRRQVVGNAKMSGLGNGEGMEVEGDSVQDYFAGL